MAKTRAAAGETRAEVAKLTDRGWSPRRIAVELGISTQAVYLHLAALRREAEEPTA